MRTQVQVSADLAAIVDMASRLHARAEDLHDGDLLGGDAMVNLAGVADLSTWQRRVDLWEVDHEPDTSTEDPDDLWPPFQLLRFWSESLRADLGADYDDPRWTPTLAGEAAWLRHPDVLGHVWEHEPHWDDFAEDVRRARVRLEDILREGDRPAAVSRVVCDRPAEVCEAPRRLIELPGVEEDESDTRWKCPTCRSMYDRDALYRAYATQMRREDSARYVPQADALAILGRFGRSERVVKRWLAEDGVPVERYCDPVTHRVYVWWPSLWRLHTARRHAKQSA